MNYIDFYLSGPVADALGWTLLHAVWQGFALVLPTAVILHLLRSRSSVFRYRTGVLTLAVQVILSAATFVWHYQPVTNHSPLSPATTARYAMAIRWETVAQTIPWHQQMRFFLENHLSQFVLIYLIGVGLFGLRLAGGWFYLQRLTQTASEPTNPIWMQLTDRLRSSLAIQSVVRVRESARIAMPMVVGVLKPVLLLPVGLITHLSTREIEAVLAHELAHIKRHDYAVNLLQSLVEVLYFFHPALWWLSARVREEREHCCDDLAVAACGGDGRILAQALARVEELRLAHMEQTPALAMAFASKRQHLLHRVRRMLGVPTRPFVTNGSLAGLTLATLLLMSMSVYAVQQQDKPKLKQPKPQSTRRHKVDSHSEYGMVDNKKVSYVIWKGQKLPASRVAVLQKLLNQVQAGQLNLDDVEQPDRDILLTIIEKNSAFDGGMEGLAAGLAHIEYDNIVASALKNVPLSPDGTVEGLAKVDYNAIISDAMASVSHLTIPNDSLDRQRAYHQRQMDSLSQLLSQRSQQMQAIRLQMEKFRFPVEESERGQQVLEWRKDKLMEQRNTLIEKHQRLLQNEGKQKLTQADIEKQLAALEPEIKKQEAGIDEMNQKLEDAQAKLKATQQPLEKLEKDAEKLEEEVDKLSDEIGKHGDGIARMIPEDRMIEYEYDLRHARPARAPRPPRVPHSVIAPNVTIAHPPVPPAPVRGNAKTITIRPATPKIAPMPRPAVAPKPPKP